MTTSVNQSLLNSNVSISPENSLLEIELNTYYFSQLQSLSDKIIPQFNLEDEIVCKFYFREKSIDLDKVSLVLYIYDSLNSAEVKYSLLTKYIDYTFEEINEKIDDEDSEKTHIVTVVIQNSNLLSSIRYSRSHPGSSIIYSKLSVNYNEEVVIKTEDNGVTLFSQNEEVVYQIPMSTPYVQSNSKIIYIENSINNTDKEEYSYITKINTPDGINFYGVKREPFFIYENTLPNYTAKEKPNINADIVVLHPNSKQTQIYSFKNGQQNMQMSQYALELAKSNNGKILPHYIQSYEYKIDGTIPNDVSSYNISFCGSIAYSGKTTADQSFIGLDNIIKSIKTVFSDNSIELNEKERVLSQALSYTFDLPFSYTYTVLSEAKGNQSLDEVLDFYKVKTSSTISKILNRNNIYENTYISINSDNYGLYRSYIDVIDIYEKITEYVKIPKSLITNSDIENSINEVENLYGTNKLYRYDSSSSTYKYIDNISQKSSDIFSKCIYYNKITSNINSTVQNTIKLDKNRTASSQNIIRYIQDYEYIEVQNIDEEPNPKSLYYIQKKISEEENAYFPIQAGIVNDGSIEYYGYTYVAIPDNKLDSIDPETEIYIKQDYTPIDFNNITDSDLNNLYSYEGNSIIYKESIGNTEYIFNLDISGKTIYGNTSNTPISKSDLEEKYFKESSSGNDWFTKDIQKETVTNNLFKYSLPANYNIGSRIDYNGKWNKIDIKKFKETHKTETYIEYLRDLSNEGKLFIKKQGYNKINISDIVKGYNIEFFVYGIGKISPTNITIINEENPVYVDATKYINNNDDNSNIVHPLFDNDIDLLPINQNGFIIFEQGISNYFTRKPVKTKCEDLYYFTNKEYYSKYLSDLQSTLEETTVTQYGTLKSIPLSYLSIKFSENDESFSYSLLNLFGSKGLPQEDDHLVNIYTKLKKDFVKEIKDYQIDGIPVSYSIGNNSDLYTCNDISTLKVLNSYNYYTNNEFVINSENDIFLPESYNYEYSLGLNGFSTAYTFSYDNIIYYKENISHYVLSDLYNSVSNLDDNIYTDKFLTSKYFYPEFTVNNGIHQAKDGSYYTTISVFDGSRGTISKSLFLNPNVFNVTEYTYDYTVDTLIEVDYDEDLRNISQHHYSDYYISENGSTPRQLSAEDKSPSYYQNYFVNLTDNSKLYIHKEKTVTAKYDGRNIGPINNLQVQYIDNLTYEPKTIQKGNLIFGIIFNTDLSSQILTNTITDDDIIDASSNLFVSPLYKLDNSISYEYTVVQLKEYLVEEKNTIENISIWQNPSSTYKNISLTTPFYLANEKALEFTGTYHWNLPQHSYVFKKDQNNRYIAYDIMIDTGYWEKEYNINSIPFTVASYNFYADTSKISNTTASYNYIPESKVIKSVIEHPEISYNYMVPETKEITRFTYIYNGKEYNYPSTSKVEYKADGTYIGLIDIKTNTNETESLLVELIKHIDVETSSVVKNIVHQPQSTTYEYFAYKTSLALSNEKVPVLYNTEIVPASSHKILYWNEDASTYAIKTVVDSYAHYVYNYLYETIPFITSSYIYSNGDLTIAYINDISTSVDTLANNIEVSVNELKSNIALIPQNIESINETITSSSNEKISSFSTYLNNIATSISDSIVVASQQIISYMSNEVTSTPSTINTNVITQSIDNQSDIVSSYFNDLNTKLYDLTINVSTQLNSLKTDINDSINNLLTYNSENIANILKTGIKVRQAPTYEEFMIELTKLMYSQINFDEDIIETEQKDENGNILSKTKHKPNPINLAKKTIYRADILWQELKKKNIVS